MTASPRPLGVIERVGSGGTLSWSPKRRGAVYCAPACGAGCTWSAYQRARRAGARLAKRLGKGWAVRMNENMGWYYSVDSRCGRLQVSGPGDSASYRKHYTAYLGDGRWCATATSPEVAIRVVVEAARRAHERLGVLLDNLPMGQRKPRGRVLGRR